MAAINTEEFDRSKDYIVGATPSAGPFAITFPFGGDTSTIRVRINGVDEEDFTVTVADGETADDNFVTLGAPVSDVTVTVYSATGAYRQLPESFVGRELSWEVDRIFALFQEFNQALGDYVNSGANGLQNVTFEAQAISSGATPFVTYADGTLTFGIPAGLPGEDANVEAFGIGVATPPSIENLDLVNRATGLYRALNLGTTTTGSYPAELAGDWGLLFHTSYNTTNARQYIWSIASDRDEVWTRVCRNSTWQGWKRLADTDWTDRRYAISVDEEPTEAEITGDAFPQATGAMVLFPGGAWVRDSDGWVKKGDVDAALALAAQAILDKPGQIRMGHFDTVPANRILANPTDMAAPPVDAEPDEILRILGFTATKLATEGQWSRLNPDANHPSISKGGRIQCPSGSDTVTVYFKEPFPIELWNRPTVTPEPGPLNVPVLVGVENAADSRQAFVIRVWEWKGTTWGTPSGNIWLYWTAEGE